MKYTTTILLFLITVGLQAQNRKVLRPIIKKNPVELLIGKKKTYYNINNGVDFPVDGLSKIIIYSRERITTKTAGYTINYSFDNNQKNTYKTPASTIDTHSAYVNKAIRYRTSKLYKKTILVPKNSKILHLSAKTKLVDVYVRNHKNKKQIKPIKAKKVVILTGKIANYYKLNSKIPTLLYIKDEGKLSVYTRKRINKKDKFKYTYSYKINNEKMINIKVDKTRLATNAIYKSLANKKRPSIYHKETIRVKKNSKIIFSSVDNVDARFVFEKKWIKLTPHKADEVKLITKKGDKIVTYYRLSPKNTFDFNINANKSQQIQLFLRGEFTYDMLANNDYEIVLKDFDNIVKTYKLSCNRSKEMNYLSEKDKIPGTLDKVIFKVPQGNHNYSISIKNHYKTALIRVLIQK